MVRGEVSGEAALQDVVLEELGGAVRYRNWICELAHPWLGAEPLEIGSGSGDYAGQWAAMGSRITASEADASRLSELRRRFADNPRVQVRPLLLPCSDSGSYSSIVAINVLEHIEDDLTALRSMRNLLRPAGHVVIFVPAMPFAMSSFDHRIGHHRRYDRAGLSAKLRAAGLEPLVAHYVNAPGLVAWLVLMRLGRGRPREGVALRTFERLVPILQRMEACRPPPWGQSLFAAAIKR
jgi:2-polyprenyl-3-methyl-5-hydroxy-6-metoxy-1,4-benzoquinol methylase